MRRVASVTALLVAALSAAGAPPAAAVPGDGLTARLSLGPSLAETNGPASAPAVADNGHVAYATFATALGFTDANDESDVVVATAPGVNVLVSRTAGGAAGNGPSDSPAISADGRYVAFRSDATDLGVTDTNGVGDVYLLDRDPSGDGLDGADRTMTRVSQPSGGQANGASDQPALAVVNGTLHVAFRSAATNLTPPDRNRVADVFVRNMTTGVVTRASLGADGAEANGPSANPSLGGTAGELVVAFESYADNLALPDDGNGLLDVYARVLGAVPTTEFVSKGNGFAPNGASYDPSVDGDGSHVAFASDATDLVFNDTTPWTDVYVRARGGLLDRYSGNARTDQPALSADGTALAVRSFATNLIDNVNDTNQVRDVFLLDLADATTVRSSVSSAGVPGDGRSEHPAVSANGEYVAFRSDATTLASDTNGVSDVFRRRRDALAPSAPLLGGATTGVWSKDGTIDVTVSSSDPGTGVQSGLDGYGVVWDTSATTVPAVVTVQETATTLTSPSRSTGQNHYVHVRARDNEGNWSAVVHRGPFWVDVSPPSITLKVNGVATSFTVMKATSTPLQLVASDTGSGLDTTGFKIYYERARYDRATNDYEPRVLWKTTTATTHTFTGAVGYTYHITVERRDKAGNVTNTHDGFLRQGFVQYPVDDTSAAQVTDSAWVLQTSSSHYGGEAQRATSSGAYLRLPVKFGDEVGVLATICETCGVIRAYIGGSYLGEYDLNTQGSTTTTHNKAITWGTADRSGYLDIKVVSSGKPVVISGLVVWRRVF